MEQYYSSRYFRSAVSNGLAVVEGNIDNVVKWIADALPHHIYIDDKQVERIAVQKSEWENIFKFAAPTEVLTKAVGPPKSLVYIR